MKTECKWWPIIELSNLVACVSISSSLGPQVLDLTASDHMTSNKFIYLTWLILILCLMSQWRMTLKLKFMALVRHTHFQTCLLNFVLYISGCLFNLIHVKKLTCILDCSILFIDNFVYVQDRRIGRMIGTRSESERLYHLSPSVACVSIACKSPTHQCLGHLSLKKCIF